MKHLKDLFGWQPIESAPTNGMSVQIMDSFVTSGRKLDDGRLEQTGADGYGIISARYDSQHGWVMHQRSGIVVKLNNPTHHRSLPPKPGEPDPVLRLIEVMEQMAEALMEINDPINSFDIVRTTKEALIAYRALCKELGGEK